MRLWSFKLLNVIGRGMNNEKKQIKQCRTSDKMMFCRFQSQLANDHLERYNSMNLVGEVVEF